MNEIKNQHQLADDIATIEMGLFRLIQPFFDATNINEPTKTTARNETRFAGVSSDTLAREFEFLGEFSLDVRLYRRFGLSHIYGFQVDNHHSLINVRYPLRLLLLAKAVDNEARPIFQPEMFAVNHSALRTEYALEHLKWWMKDRLGEHLLPFED